MNDLETEITTKTIYVEPEDRFVVSLVVSYGGHNDDVKTPEHALAAAIALTKDDASSGTHWYVFDRKTGEGRMYEQSEADGIAVE